MFNKRMLREDDIMDSIVNSGGLYHPGAISGKDLMGQTGAAKYIPVDDEWDFSNAFQPLQLGNLPQGFESKRDFLYQLPFRIAGLPESAQGFDEGGNTQVSGRLAEVRAANGVRSNRAIFDNLEYAQKLLGSKTMQAIQLNYGSNLRNETGQRVDIGKVTRILGEEPSEEFFNLDFDQYDSVIRLDVLSQTQRDSLYFEVLRLTEIWGPEAVPITTAFKNLPMAGASEVLEDIEQREQQNQQAKQAEAEDRQRRNMLIDSQTDQSIALAQERRAKIHSDLALSAERVSEAEENRASAALDRAKTMTEIQALGDDRFFKLMEFVEVLQNREKSDRDKVQRDVEVKAVSLGSGPSPLQTQIQQEKQSNPQDMGQPNLLGG
jgi:hypothetical protein